MKTPWILAGLLVLGLPSHDVQAFSCTASATPLNFGQVSPIRGAAANVTGTVTVTCTWPPAPLMRNVQICLNVGAGNVPFSAGTRNLASGTNRMSFDLYQDAAHTRIWGSIYAANGTTPISLTMSKPLGQPSVTRTVNFFGRVMANQPTVPTVGNANTIYTNVFNGNHTLMNAEAYLATPRGCAATGTSSGTFPFTATATVINECTINTTNVNFGTAGMLDRELNATGALSVRCTNGDAYRVALNGGGSRNVAARHMSRETGASIVSYQLYTDAGRNLVWGDGTAGTSMVTGTGTGRADTLTIHGRVPAQRTPRPGAYRDTITATVSF